MAENRPRISSIKALTVYSSFCSMTLVQNWNLRKTAASSTATEEKYDSLAEFDVSSDKKQAIARRSLSESTMSDALPQQNYWTVDSECEAAMPHTDSTLLTTTHTDHTQTHRQTHTQTTQTHRPHRQTHTQTHRQTHTDHTQTDHTQTHTRTTQRKHTQVELLSAHDDRQGVDISFTVCLFVRLRISPPRIKLAASQWPPTATHSCCIQRWTDCWW